MYILQSLLYQILADSAMNGMEKWTKERDTGKTKLDVLYIVCYYLFYIYVIYQITLLNEE